MTRRLFTSLFACALCACGSSHPVAGDGGAVDAAVDGPDAGACVPGDVAGWSCVQGDRATHVCTDSMYAPSCTAGRWQCASGGEPDWYVDCWCHVGPWPWPDYVSLCACTEADGWTCDFHCGPDVLCTAYSEYCQRVGSDVGGEPDSFSCRAFEACSSGVPGCDCVAAGSVSCEAVENGGLVATYPGG